MTTLQDRPNTALLVIDMQNGVVGAAYDVKRVTANVNIAIDKAREARRHRLHQSLLGWPSGPSPHWGVLATAELDFG